MPKLVGLSVAAARAAWTGAGFTGTFIPLRGHDLAIVQSQTPTAGGCLPATTSVTVTWK